jgi:dimethylargininase
MIRHAIVRPPAAGFEQGLTSAGLGPPDLALARDQHEAYCRALEQCGVTVLRLPSDPRFPDSTFVEDTAVVTDRAALLTCPGAPSRRGEVASIADALALFRPSAFTIEAPATLEGGDICQVETHFFLGLSGRTNQEGAAQLAAFLAGHGFTSSNVEVRGPILHLKSGMSYLGQGRLALAGALVGHPAFTGYEAVPVADEETYAANCIEVNGTILIAAGFPRFAEALERLGYPVVPLAMSEFQKMDGGLSCLSLRLA